MSIRGSPVRLFPGTNQSQEMNVRFLSMVKVDEKSGQKPSERLMKEMGKLVEEATREGWLVKTAGLRPTSEGKRVRWNRGKLSQTDGPFTETKEVIGGYAILQAKSMQSRSSGRRRPREPGGVDHGRARGWTAHRRRAARNRGAATRSLPRA